MNTLFASSTLILSGGQVVIGLAAVGLAIYLGIFATKTYLQNQSQKIKAHGISTTSATVRKHGAVDVLQHSKNIRLAGFSASLAIVLIIFAYTQIINEQVLADLGIDYADDIQMEIPPTAQPQPKLPPALPPPPSAPSVDIVVVDKVPDDEPEDKPTEVTESKTPTDYTGPVSETSTYIPPAPILEDEPKEEKPAKEIVFQIVEQMPRFPGCEDQDGDHRAKKACSDSKLLNYINTSIVYPTIARENGIEGLAVVSFVVKKDGSIGDYKILKDPGGGCGKEAMRVVKMMNKMKNKWTPGKQRGKSVSVRYNLPVKFRLS